MKKGLLIIIVCILLWFVCGIADFMLVRTYRKPLFCIGVDLADDGGSGKYIGLGYSFNLEGGFMPDDGEPDVTSYRGYIWGKEITRGFWEKMLPGIGVIE